MLSNLGRLNNSSFVILRYDDLEGKIRVYSHEQKVARAFRGEFGNSTTRPIGNSFSLERMFTLDKTESLRKLAGQITNNLSVHNCTFQW